MRTEEFDYELPHQLIAQVPETERSASRLLVLHRQNGTIEHAFFRDITRYLKKGDMLVLNDTKVLPGRLKGKKATGGLVDLLLVEKIDEHRWSCLVGGAKRTSDLLDVQIDDVQVRLERKEDFWQVDFLDASAEEIMARHGTMPLPHYIKRGENGVGVLDAERYQTVYAEKEGSIAAPTAGLHFTEALLDRISLMGVTIVKITLHIGVGTFFLVKKEHVEEHRMHREYFSVQRHVLELIREAKARGGRVLAVGTSAVRTLETLGSRNYSDTGGSSGNGAVDGPCHGARTGSGNNGGSDNGGHIGPGTIEDYTDLFIRPGYRFASVDGMITNFHLPRSTPLLLVCAFAGKENIFGAYRQAMALSYRFYSYGDAMLIL
ncbi:MAG TPA: tRNA preQ1(34) S-adenosylmethionine ribosyltransferase-isomerase QueA [Syntrophorhabdales bacterium]|nr:tRNA preQ1(34) S-adenosylmethionine ribosyltransferase-isomerase QueA [Syntrophorhabdales bacterium]